MITCVYFDMDGVLVDFENLLYAARNLKSKISKENFLLELNLMKKEYKYNSYIFDLIHIAVNAELFKSAPVHKGFYKLLKLMETLSFNRINYQILSSVTSDSTLNRDSLKSQKITWLSNLGFSNIEANFSLGSSLKLSYVSPTSILIDDKLETIQKWNQLGGIGIHYTDENTDEVIELVLSLIKSS